MMALCDDYLGRSVAGGSQAGILALAAGSSGMKGPHLIAIPRPFDGSAGQHTLNTRQKAITYLKVNQIA